METNDWLCTKLFSIHHSCLLFHRFLLMLCLSLLVFLHFLSFTAAWHAPHRTIMLILIYRIRRPKMRALLWAAAVACSLHIGTSQVAPSVPEFRWLHSRTRPCFLSCPRSRYYFVLLCLRWVNSASIMHCSTQSYLRTLFCILAETFFPTHSSYIPTISKAGGSTLSADGFRFVGSGPCAINQVRKSSLFVWQ
jgi:hypothetical protein